MAKITITIEDSDDSEKTNVSIDKDTPGPLTGGGTGAEQIAYLLACLLQEASAMGDAN